MSDSEANFVPGRRAFLSALAMSPVALTVPAFINPEPVRAQDAVFARAAIHRRMVGDIEVIALSDGFASLPINLMAGLDEDEARVAAEAAYKPHDPSMMQIAVNGYLIRSGNRVVAVDTGAPSAMAPTAGAWAASLALTGIAPEDIDTLFLTHMHGDHVGGMTGGDGARLLPNAQLVAAEAEWHFTYDDGVLAAIPEAFRQNFLFSRAQGLPYAEGRRMLQMSGETEIASGVTAVPLPGHTPGHMGLRVASGKETLMIWGDVVHAPAYQFMHPEWSILFDADMDMARQTRARILDQVSADRTMVAGMHLDFPALGFVERRGDAYRYVSAPPDYRI